MGDFDPREIKNYIINLFRDWRGQEVSFMEENAPFEKKENKLRILKESHQTQIMLGFRGPGLLSEKRPLLEVLNSALSGQDGPLFRILRDERSLAYAVTSFLVFYPKSSALIFYLGCDPEKENQAINGFFEVLNQIKKEGFSEKDLERAKKRLLGKYRMNLQGNLAKAEDMAVNMILGLGWDYSERFEEEIKNITSEDLTKAMDEFLKEDSASLLILGREKNNH